MLLSQSVDILSDDELVKLAQSGDKVATECIILRYRNLVTSCMPGYFAKGFDRDDIFQEGMIGLYKAILDYDSTKASFRSFAMLCISRKIISLVKSSTRKKNLPLNTSISLNSSVCESNDRYLVDILKGSDESNPEIMFINKESFNHCKKKINGILSPFEKKVLSYQLEKMSYKKIGEKLGRDIKSIDNAVQRIRKKLEGI